MRGLRRQTALVTAASMGIGAASAAALVSCARDPLNI